MCGKSSSADAGGDASLTGGIVVIRKLFRSLYRMRSATTEIGEEDVEIRTTPANGSCSVGKISVKNEATWPDAGIGTVFVTPRLKPAVVYRSNVTVPAEA